MDFTKSARQVKSKKSKHSPRRYKYGDNTMSPQDRIKFLRGTASDIPIDPFESIQSYLKLSRDLFNEATDLLSTGHYLDSYIILVRFYSIFSKRIKTHPEYRSLGEHETKQLSKSCSIVENRIASLESKLLGGFSKEQVAPTALAGPIRLRQKEELNLLGLLRERIPLTRTESQLRELEHRLYNLFTNKGNNEKGYLSASDFQLLLFKLAISQDVQDSERLFQQYKKPVTQDGRVSKEEFADFVVSLMQFPAVERIFNEYKSSDGLLSASALHKFVTANQGLHSKQYSVTDCTLLISKHELSETSGQMTLYGFQDFLMSPEFSVFKSKNSEVYQNMTEPLCNYYISSAINPFSSATRIKSPEIFKRKILLDGCRSIDLQIWDGGESDGYEPIIKFGDGSTGVLLADLLKNGIKPYAFTASKFPLFLCLDINCDREGRRKIGVLLEEILGDLIFKVDVKTLDRLPSPIHLRSKIIIRASKSLQDSATPQEASLSALVNVCEQVPFRSFQSSAAADYFYHSSSFPETQALQLGEAEGKDFINYNKGHISKILPSESRTSNLDPFAFWVLGCQLVGMHYLHTDVKWLANRGFFSENGNSGYILKPRILRDPQLSFDPLSSTIPTYEKYLKLRLEIISGHFLPQPTRPTIISPYIKAQIMGFDHDKQGFETEVVAHNGFNPVWDTTLEFDIYTFDFAMLFLIVYDGAKENNPGTKDAKLAFYSIPVLAMDTGYRFLHLFDKVGNSLTPSMLFVNIEKIFQSIEKSDTKNEAEDLEKP